MSFDVRSYWPFPAGGATLTNTFTGGVVLTYSAVPNTPGRAGSGIRMYTTQNGVWINDWFYRADPVRGILEFEDDYPPSSWWQRIIYPSGVVPRVMAPGREVIWGGTQNFGDDIQAQAEIKGGPFGIGAVWGWQQVKFTALLPSFVVPAGTFASVLQLEYWQSWTNSSTISGAVLYLAPGLGQIKAAWTINRVPTGQFMELISTEGMPVA